MAKLKNYNLTNRKVDFIGINLQSLVVLSLILSGCGYFLFYNALRYSLPFGGAGLFSQMAEQISNNNFQLPSKVDYYGPGGIPFGYPPLALYLYAVLLKLGISPFTVLRYLPPLVSLAALIPLYLIIVEITGSRLAGYLGMAFSAVALDLYHMHTWSTGVVRAPAFFLLLSAIYGFLRASSEKQMRLMIISGILFGLTVLTHLLYALFFILWLTAWLMVKPTGTQLKTTIVICGVANLIFLPWLIFVISRHGYDIFLFSMSTHGNLSFLYYVRSFDRLLYWILEKLALLPHDPILNILLVIGIIQLLIKRQIEILLVSLFFLIFFSTEGSRFVNIIIPIILGASLLIYNSLPDNFKGIQVILIGLYAVLLFQTWEHGFNYIKKLYPGIHDGAFEIADYVQNNTQTSSRYLFVVGRTEAEWFPYLLKRDPFVMSFGAEWLGTYNDQLSLQQNIRICQETQSLSCLEKLSVNIQPSDFLITRKKEANLTDELMKSEGCIKRASAGSYILWNPTCLMK